MLLKSKKRLTAYVLAALCVASTGFAATEHWNDASTTPNTVVATQAGDANWEQWKTTRTAMPSSSSSTPTTTMRLTMKP
ncbi:hypothetical protein [Mitsuokella multacida]|uniref:hypothetical protein n=1 Tax=Mitsuokella multacida TaxID=52226 RepID=UPI0026DFC816|nr:hypothetical protein [Mitsuokella multacida]